MSKRTVLAKGVAMSAESRVTRRAALGALAGASIFPQISDVVAEQADPVFAVLQRHKAAWAAADALSPSVDDVLAKRKGRKVSQVDRDAHKRASSREAEALDELLSTPPTTAAGMQAAIRYLVRAVPAEAESGADSHDEGNLIHRGGRTGGRLSWPNPIPTTFVRALFGLWRAEAHATPLRPISK